VRHSSSCLSRLYIFNDSKSVFTDLYIYFLRHFTCRVLTKASTTCCCTSLRRQCQVNFSVQVPILI